MKARSFLLVVAALTSIAPAAPGEQRPTRTNWAAMSECWKPVKGKGGDVKIKIGLSTYDLDRASCDTVGKAKATGMATGGWFCFGDEKRPMEVTHVCSQMTQAEEDLGLKDVRRRAPTWNTYLVFTDLDGHLTQVSFWDLPKAVAGPLCEAFRLDLSKSGIKNAACVPGNG